MRGVRRGCVRLKGAVIGIDNEDDSTFTITVDHKTFHFQARDAEEREKWVRALEDTIFRHGSRVSECFVLFSLVFHTALFIKMFVLNGNEILYGKLRDCLRAVNTMRFE